MVGRHLISGPVLLALVTLTPACSSRDQRAATAAGIAADALQQGQIAVARQQISKALGLRDDIGDYWLISAHVALAEGNYGGAFEAYESVLSFDKNNAEALTRLCQIAISAGQADRAERYADRLAAIHPGDAAALTVQADLALKNADLKGAASLLDRVLAAQPGDPLALIVKSKLLAAQDDYAGAAKAAEASLAAPGDPMGRLNVLRGVYLKAKDAEGYRRTIARIARAAPAAGDAQLDYAQSLYDAGDADGGLAVAKRILATHPDDAAAADAVLNLWVAQGSSAMPIGAITADAANVSPEGQAAYAQYAIAIGRPDLALTVLGDSTEQGPATAANANARAARAYARALRGDTAGAGAEAATVLAVDADQPRALVVRAWLRAKAGDRRGAIEDYRHALAGDPANANARLALADLQLREGDAVLAITTLQDGLSDPGADPRLATRLAALLRTQGRAAQAQGVLQAYARDNPFSRQPRA